MAEYALIEDGQITELAGELPDSWRNVSGLQAMRNDEEFLAKLGWVKIKKTEVALNPFTQSLGPPRYIVQEDGSVVQENDVITHEQEIQAQYIPSQLTWEEVRSRRAALMSAMSYRYERWQRNDRLGLPQVDNLDEMDTYMQKLADVTTEFAETRDIIWPQYPRVITA